MDPTAIDNGQGCDLTKNHDLKKAHAASGSNFSQALGRSITFFSLTLSSFPPSLKQFKFGIIKKIKKQ